jgi:hypothetical protein
MTKFVTSFYEHKVREPAWCSPKCVSNDLITSEFAAFPYNVRGTAKSLLFLRGLTLLVFALAGPDLLALQIITLERESLVDANDVAERLGPVLVVLPMMIAMAASRFPPTPVALAAGTTSSRPCLSFFAIWSERRTGGKKS